MERICVRHLYRSGVYVLTFEDKTGNYCDLLALPCFEELYDWNTGEPVTDEVKEMDDCILKRWNPELFRKLFNKLNPNGELVID